MWPFSASHRASRPTPFLLEDRGLGWVFELTNLPVVGKVADNLYDFWADNRLRLTGRGELADILKARAQELQEMELDVDFDCEEECGLDYDDLP